MLDRLVVFTGWLADLGVSEVVTIELMWPLASVAPEVDTEEETLMAPITIAIAAEAATMTRLASNGVLIDGLRIPLLILCILSHTLLSLARDLCLIDFYIIFRITEILARLTHSD